MIPRMVSNTKIIKKNFGEKTQQKKTILLLLLTITTLILLSTASATQDNTITTPTSSIKEKTTTIEPIVKEKIKNPEKQATNKEIRKENKTKNNKKESIIIDGTEYTQVYENQIIRDYEEYTENSFFNKCDILIKNDYYKYGKNLIYANTHNIKK